MLFRKVFLYFSFRLVTFFLCCFFILSSSASAVLSNEQKSLMRSGILNFDITPGVICNTPSQSAEVATGPIYMVGDSITEGARSLLETAFPENSFTVYNINAVVGRSVRGGGETGETGLQAVANDASLIQEASTVVVALGTNGVSEQDIRDMIEAIRSVKQRQQVAIYWVNVFSPGGIGKEEFNANLKRLSVPTELDFNVIDTTTAKIEVSTDNLHPTAAGQTAFTQTVIAALRGSSSTTSTAAGCTCSVGGNGGDRDARYQAAWAYLTTNKGLSPEAAAGVMGNLEAESWNTEEQAGIDPHNVQDSANRRGIPDGPEIPIADIRGTDGYGIAQWTSGGRQDNLIAYARETNRSTGDLGLQIDFLWKELEESYAGVLAVLQTPGITVDEASFIFLSEFEIPLPFTDRGTAEGRARETANRLGRSTAIYNEFSGQSLTSTLGGGCGSNGTNIDLESRDTTNIPCGGGTQDAGVAEGYRNGQSYQIRLCTVGGTQVNSQISASLEKLLVDSAAAGIGISFGSFRTMDRQESMYRERCARQGIMIPDDEVFPKPTAGDNISCDSIAPPGYSNHQMGLAIDVSCDGTLIPRYHPEAASNRCFQWLSSNAARYGLYEFGKGEGSKTSGSYEAWHWSVDGS